MGFMAGLFLCGLPIDLALWALIFWAYLALARLF